MKQVSLKSAAVEVDILPEVGARLHRLRAFGRDILRAPANPEEHIRDPFFWGGYTMAPWCGRVDAGPLKVANRQLALRSNFRDGSPTSPTVSPCPTVRSMPSRGRSSTRVGFGYAGAATHGRGLTR